MCFSLWIPLKNKKLGFDELSNKNEVVNLRETTEMSLIDFEGRFEYVEASKVEAFSSEP